jgi:hypothetical protein
MDPIQKDAKGICPYMSLCVVRVYFAFPVNNKVWVSTFLGMYGQEKQSRPYFLWVRKLSCTEPCTVQCVAHIYDCPRTRQHCTIAMLNEA